MLELSLVSKSRIKIARKTPTHITNRPHPSRLQNIRHANVPVFLGKTLGDRNLRGKYIERTDALYSPEDLLTDKYIVCGEGGEGGGE